MEHLIPWTIDTDYCHHGMPLSNGVFGALVWFAGSEIMITINRADYWDRRGGTEWTEDCTFTRLRELLAKRDFESVRKLFRPALVNGKEKRPTRMPLGRLELTLEAGYRPVSASLDTAAGEVRVELRNDDGAEADLAASVLIEEPAVAVRCPVIAEYRPVPAYEFPQVREYFDAFGIPVPEERTVSDQTAGKGQGENRGWLQQLPADADAAVLASTTGFGLIAACELATEDPAADALCAATIARIRSGHRDYDAVTGLTRERWARLAEESAEIELGDTVLERMYRLGIFKMLGNSMPGRLAPTLQGPWVEEHRMPPWSGDYHFNINVQECLWPAYASGHHGSLLPLFTMLRDWEPVLRSRARSFAGVEDGLQLSHACDDRGTTIGGFWTGAVDHANTSWVAQMMWLYFAYTGDRAFLEDTAVPFLVGAFRVFQAFMDRETGSLPVTVSPEYGGAGDDAWGANSSFFLANVRFLCEKIVESAAILPDHELFTDGRLVSDAERIRVALPLFTTGPHGGPQMDGASSTEREIYLWEGQPLAQSHRHHSHLAAVYPFDLVDPEDEETAEILSASYRTWARQGMGQWTGWSMPWASIIHGRLGNPEMAVLCLRILAEVFTMPGYATRHNAMHPGFTVFTGGDIMQVEAAIAFSAAVLELFVQNIRGTVRLFAGVPPSMPDCTFDSVWTEGGFCVSGVRTGGEIRSIDIVSTRGGTLRLENPTAATRVYHESLDSEALIGEYADRRFAIETQPGHRYLLRPVSD